MVVGGCGDMDEVEEKRGDEKRGEEKKRAMIVPVC